MHRGRIGLLLGIALASACAGHAFAQAGNASVPWTNGPVEGVSLGDWTAQWWRWTQHAAIAPYLDPDGRLCDMDQSGSVWFLAGTDGTFEPRRRCVVPEGKYLLLPVINMYYQHRVAKGQSANCSQVQARAAVNNDHLVSAVVVLDGKPLGDMRVHRVRSNCFQPNPGDGSSTLAASDGYWLMLKPLPRGRHTISVGANYGAPGQAYGDMTQNFEYELDVGGKTLLGMREQSGDMCW